jgi:hypothetical protein
MKSLNLNMVTLALMLATTNLNAQLKSDIGIRMSTSRLEKIQLEFRKPVNENYSLRFALSTGENYSLPFYEHRVRLIRTQTRCKSTVMQVHSSPDAYNLRAGFQRNLKWNVLSIYSDLLVGYYHQNSNGYMTYYVDTPRRRVVIQPIILIHIFPQEYYSTQYHNSHWSADYISTGLSIRCITRRSILQINFRS